MCYEFLPYMLTCILNMFLDNVSTILPERLFDRNESLFVKNKRIISSPRQYTYGGLVNFKAVFNFILIKPCKRA